MTTILRESKSQSISSSYSQPKRKKWNIHQANNGLATWTNDPILLGHYRYQQKRTQLFKPNVMPL